MISKHKLTEFILKEGDFKLVIRNQVASDPAIPTSVMMPVQQPMVTMTTAPIAAPAAPPAPKTEGAPATPAAEEQNPRLVTIKSPMVGTFYRSSTPDKPAFVKIGDSIEAGNPVCIIEAMKLFNEIESDVKGKIVKILVEDASPVEYDQPLFLVDPA